MSTPLQHLEKNWTSHVEDLKKLARIPSVSFEGFPKEEVVRSANAVADLLNNRGLKNVEILKVGDAHPAVYGEFIVDPKLPTVLLYAHHDVQPPGRIEFWKTKPFEPVILPGPGGDRLYGRGTADDKAGVVVHTAAISAFLESGRPLPVNVKVLVEGEEEIGSVHLPLFLNTFRSKLAADLMILTDTMNFDCGVPGLTVSLRGLVGLEVEVRGLTKTVHSGMLGGPIPDPAQALSKILSELTDSNGQIAVPEIKALIPPLSEAEKHRFSKIPFDLERFREQSGILDGVPLLNPEISPWAQLWRLPALTVNAIQASSRAQAGNIINDTAWAKITIRVGQGMSAKETRVALEKALRRSLPWGLEMTIVEEACNEPWDRSPENCEPSVARVYGLALRALKDGYGCDPVFVGCGGSIPFVKPIAEALEGAPALLIGVEDPFTNAHGENESLLLSDLKNACKSEIRLFELLGAEFRQS